jgi:hypothetical protein
MTSKSRKPIHSRLRKKFCQLLSGLSSIDVRELSGSDFESLVQLALKSWQVLPEVGPRILSGLSDEQWESKWRRTLEDAVTGVKAYSQVQLHLFEIIVKRLAEAGIPFVLLKANATRHLFYDDPVDRTGWDLDLGVPVECLNLAESLVIQEGFVPAEFDLSTKKWYTANSYNRALAEKQHYELGFLVRRQQVAGLGEDVLAAIDREDFNRSYWKQELDGEPVCYVTVDIHHGLSLDIGIAGALNSAQVYEPEKWPYPVPSRAWLALHLIFKIYWEGVHAYGGGIYQFSDLARLFPCMTSADFHELSELLRQHSMEAGAFYVFHHLKNDFGVQFPPEQEEFIVRACMPESGEEDPLRVNDLGDMWPKLWGARLLE